LSPSNIFHIGKFQFIYFSKKIEMFLSPKAIMTLIKEKFKNDGHRWKTKSRGGPNTGTGAPKG
jgi:hypothetical protein